MDVMGAAIVGIGIPGSGKTTFLRALAERRGYAYVNKDALREELLGDIEDQSQNRAIWLESNRRIKEALAEGQTVVLDSTHAERWKREELVAFLRESGARTVVAVYFSVPLEVALQRNTGRERAVPESAIRSLESLLMRSPPTTEEGFDAVYTPATLPEVL